MDLSASGRRFRDRRAPTNEIEPRLHDALTDLHAYVLVLDAEFQRLHEASREAGGAEADAVERRCNEVGEELDALRGAIAALRTKIDPDARLVA
jgi:hypothetical protein